MINHLVFYSHRSLGIQQQACINNSAAHVQCVLLGVLTLHLYPIHHDQGFLPQSQQETAWKGQMQSLDDFGTQGIQY